MDIALAVATLNGLIPSFYPHMHFNPELIPGAPRRETGLANPPASAILYASQPSLCALPYWAGRHVENPVLPE